MNFIIPFTKSITRQIIPLNIQNHFFYNKNMPQSEMPTNWGKAWEKKTNTYETVHQKQNKWLKQSVDEPIESDEDIVEKQVQDMVEGPKKEKKDLVKEILKKSESWILKEIIIFKF